MHIQKLIFSHTQKNKNKNVFDLNKEIFIEGFRESHILVIELVALGDGWTS